MMGRLTLIVLLSMGPLGSLWAADSIDTSRVHDLTMKVGEVVVLRVDDGAVIEGRSEAIHAQFDTKDRHRLIVHAMSPGWGSVRIGEEVWTFSVADLNAGSLQAEVQALLADEPSLSVRVAGDTVIVDGLARAPSVVERVERIVEGLPGKAVSLVHHDPKERVMVLLRIDLIEVRKDSLNRLGLDFSKGGVLTTLFAFNDALMTRPFDPRALRILDDPVGNGSPLVLGGEDTNVRLRSSHTLAVLNGAWDDYLFGGKLILPVTTATSTSVTEFSYGIGVRVRPMVEGEDVVVLDLDVTVDQPIALGTYPQFTSMRQKTRVRMKPGETLAISGVLERSRQRGGKGVPALRSVPVLGALFGSRAWRRGESEALLLVTPIIGTEETRDAQDLLRTEVETAIADEEKRPW